MGPATFFRSRPHSRNRFAAAIFLAAIFLAAPLAAAPAPPMPPAPTVSDRAELAKNIINLIRQERRDEALTLCRTYTDRFPDDPAMLYNLACLENTTGSAEEAVVTFAKAVAAGFDDFLTAFSDPDLASLKHHPDMVDLAVKHQTRLLQLASAKAQTLSWQDISPPIPLAADHAGAASGDPEIHLTWTPLGLDIELHATGPWSGLVGPHNVAPWNGGSGLVFTLGIPKSDSPEKYLTSNFFLFAFGLEKDSGRGAIYLAGQDRWQSLFELQPKIRMDDAGNLELRATIPWASILPYNPLVDDLLGFNAALRLTGPGDPQTASLLTDPAAFRPLSGERRIALLKFQPASVGQEAFVGKVSGTISGAEPVNFDLVAVSPEEGPGRLAIDFLGGPEQSLLPDGQVSVTLDLVKGVNRLTRQADFTALKTGAYVIKTGLTFPSGRSLTWGSTVLQLATDWQGEFHDRIALLDPQERPTALYHLQAIEQAVAAHHPRRDPGAIVTTIIELRRLLDEAEKGGSILPDKGSFLAVYPGPAGDTRLCQVYLPAGWKIAARLNPVLTLTSATGLTDTITGRIGRNYEQGHRTPTLKAGSDEGFPVFLTPRLGPAADRRPDDPPTDLLAEAEACLAWARDTFKSNTVSVAAVDQGAGTALRLAGTRPEAMKAMIIFAGGGFEPWPRANADFIKRELAGFPERLPLTWADFVQETQIAGQGPLILRTLRELGSNIVEVQEVRGGLNFTQIADRTVLWAEGLR